MALYRPDYSLKKAEKHINNLDDSDESRLIRYYIKMKDDRIEEQRRKLKVYQDFFNSLSKLIPRQSTTHDIIG